MKKIILTSGDVPSRVQLQHAVSRLMRDHELLSKTRGKNDTEDPKSLVAVACFLDMLVRRESRNLEKGDLVHDPFVASVKDRFKTYISSLPEEEAEAIIDSLRKEVSDARMG